MKRLLLAAAAAIGCLAGAAASLVAAQRDEGTCEDPDFCWGSEVCNSPDRCYLFSCASDICNDLGGGGPSFLNCSICVSS